MSKKTSQSRQDRLAKLRERMAAVDVGSGGYFSPEQGANQIRILPEVGEMEFFFQPVGRHYLPNKKVFYCPAFTSEGELECPICELVNDLYKGDSAAKALAGQIRVRKQYWMNVIDRNNEDRGPLVYTPGTTVFAAIKNMVNDPDYGDIMDVDEGLDIVVTRKGEGIDTRYDVLARRHATPLHEDDETIDDWLDSAKNLTWAEVSEDPAEDQELAGDHFIFLLPYDRILSEAGVEDGSFVSAESGPDEDEEEEDEAEESEAKQEIRRRRASRRRRSR